MVAVTIPEGFTLPRIATRIAGITELPADTVRVRLRGQDAHKRWGLPGPGLEGYLFPDTYLFAGGVPLDAVVEAMRERYRSYWTPAREARATELELSEREVVTLASIIQAEARVSDEMPAISAVYHNRLRIGMLLQADPTVLYALGGHRPRLLFAAMDSVAGHPYNTYTQGGLPPGPIGTPGAAALDAALHPAEVDYLYFVANADGSHTFSRTLAEHNRAVARARRAVAGAGSGRRMTGAPDPLRGALRLMVITHPRPSCGRPLEEVVEEVVAAGAGAIQLRDKEAPPRKLLGLARRLRTVTARHGALLIVNDRLDIALAAGADGVHLGPDDVPVAAARRVVPDGFVLGHSTDDPGVARRAEADGADYLGCGTVFPTTSKEDAGTVIGGRRARRRGALGPHPRARHRRRDRRAHPAPGRERGGGGGGHFGGDGSRSAGERHTPAAGGGGGVGLTTRPSRSYIPPASRKPATSSPKTQNSPSVPESGPCQSEPPVASRFHARAIRSRERMRLGDVRGR